MNLRTLKKLSKRATPILPLLGDTREQFSAKRYENYTATLIRARKHWERGATVWKDIPEPSCDRICYRARSGRVISMRPPSHPLKGTPMVGGMSGYYEPEWDEETAWDSLSRMVHEHFMHYSRDGVPRPTRRLRTPSDVFNAAADMVASNRKKR
jgi:hypothetical protein